MAWYEGIVTRYMYLLILGVGEVGWIWGRKKQGRKLFKGAKEAQTKQWSETATRRFQLNKKATGKGFHDSLSLSLYVCAAYRFRVDILSSVGFGCTWHDHVLL